MSRFLNDEHIFESDADGVWITVSCSFDGTSRPAFRVLLGDMLTLADEITLKSERRKTVKFHDDEPLTEFNAVTISVKIRADLVGRVLTRAIALLESCGDTGHYPLMAGPLAELQESVQNATGRHVGPEFTGSH